MAERVGLYCRISEDRDGDQSATSRQREDCERYAASHGWEVADVFEDVDLSGWRGIHRPQFEKMIEAVRDGQLDGVLCWKIDRISRRLRDFVRLDETCEKAGAFIATTDGIDTRTQSGRFHAEILVSLARQESTNASERIKRKHLAMAQEGRPALGGTRPYGYAADRTEIIPEEAALIREAVSRITSGESIRGLVNDWQKRGVRTPTGRTWARTPLRRMLLAPCIRGQRDHNGTITHGTWDAIITPAEGAAVAHVLNGRAGPKQVAARRYLLTGFAICGRCGGRLATKAKASGVRRYICTTDGGRVNNCGRLARAAEPVEALVAESLFAALDGVDLKKHMAQPKGADADVLAEGIHADEAALEQLFRGHFVDDEITRSAFYSTRDALTARIEANRSAMAKSNGKGMLNTIAGAGEAVREQWGTRDLDWRRAVLGAVIDQVEISPAVKGRVAFDPSLVKILWKF